MTVDEIAALIEPQAIPRALAMLDDLHAAIGGCVLLFGPAATAQSSCQTFVEWTFEFFGYIIIEGMTISTRCGSLVTGEPHHD